MSDNIKDGGPAFPHETQGVSTQGNTFKRTETGMSLRDYFAAAALTGMMTDLASWPSDENDIANMASKAAYHVADAMLKARGNP